MAELSNLNLKARLKELEKQGKKDTPTYKKTYKILKENLSKIVSKPSLLSQEVAARKELITKGATPKFKQLKTYLTDVADKRRKKEIKTEELQKYMKKTGMSRKEAEFRLKNKKKNKE